MTPLTLDFETYFDKDYTVNKMTTTEYLRDPRFRILGFGLKRGDESSVWVKEHQVKPVLAKLKPVIEQSHLLMHHGQFDAGILAFHFDIRPKFHLDTMAMARALGYRNTGLGQLCAALELGFKTALTETSSEQEVATRGTTDVDLTWALFKRLAKGFPIDELKLIDLTIRWYTNPAFVANKALLKKLIARIEAKNQKMLDDLGVTSEDLASSNKLAKLLEAEGVVIEYKTGKAGKSVPCFAKTDEFMKRLIDDDNETVAELANARLGIKSTGELTRAQRLMDYARMGPIPVYLSYYGAHPGRWSGGDGTNFQNFRRGGAIRDALVAPEGYKIVKGDLSQIECRGTAWLAGQNNLLDGFREQRDVYSEFATVAFGYPVSKALEFERFSGKFVVLGAGYGMGGEKCHTQIRAEIRKRELDYMPPTEKVCAGLIETYRSMYSRIPELWTECRYKLLLNDGYSVGPVTAEGNTLKLPNGLRLHYPGLRKTAQGYEYMGREGRTRLWGGKIVQNIMEALCRIIIAGQMLELDKMGYQIISSTHDEIVMLVADEDVDDAVFNMNDIMRSIAPPWANGLPLATEVTYGQTYGSK